MTPDGAFDRRLTTWLEEDAAPRAPQGFDDVVTESVNQKRQLPSWATPERWISMETRARIGVMPRAVIALLTIAILAVGAIGGYAIGSSLVDASDGGDPLAGLTYHTREGVIYTIDGSGAPVPLTGEDEHASTLAWSPDGTRFAYLSWPDGGVGSPTIMIRDADGANPVVVGERRSRGAPGYLAWSPDGSTVLYWADGLDVADEELGCELGGAFCGKRIWSAVSDGSEPAKVIGDSALDACDPLWTPDGESIIFSGAPAGSGMDRGLYRMDGDGANVERIGDLTGTSCWHLPHSISPDGTTLAVSIEGETSDIYLVDLATGEDVLIAGKEEDESWPHWSPDGSLLAFTTIIEDGVDFVERATLYDVASAETIALGDWGSVEGWSPDGRSIVSRHIDGLPTIVDVTDPSTPVATEIEGVPDADRLSWQPRP